MKHKMELIFGSYSGVYKQFRYLEEHNLSNVITGTNFSIVCFFKNSNEIQNYGPIIGHIKINDFKNYTLTCSNFRNYVKHTCHNYCAKIEKAYYPSYKILIQQLNLIRWSRLQQKEPEIREKFKWLLYKDRSESLNIPAFKIIDLEHIQILGTDKEILFSDFAKIYEDFVKSKGYSVTINKDLKQGLNDISDFLMSVDEIGLKFNIGSTSFEKLNELVEKYDSKQVSLTAIIKSKMIIKHGIPGYLCQNYEVKQPNKHENLYFRDYETIKSETIKYGFFEENCVDVEIFNVFIPQYVVRKFN